MMAGDSSSEAPVYLVMLFGVGDAGLVERQRHVIQNPQLEQTVRKRLADCKPSASPDFHTSHWAYVSPAEGGRNS